MRDFRTISRRVLRKLPQLRTHALEVQMQCAI